MNTVRAVICLVSLVALAPAFGQEISYTTIEPTVNAANGQCVDYSPIGDGIGWNGECRCLMEPEWTGFGKNVAISGNTLAIGVVLTPERCPVADTFFSFPPSTSVSIYEKSASGSWIKETEFRPLDGTGFNSMSFDSDGKLHIGDNVYGSINGEWQLVSTSDITADSSGDLQFDIRIPILNPQFTTVFQGSIIVLDLSNNMHRWIRDQSGGWVKSEVFATNLPYRYSYQEKVPFPSDNTLLLTTVGHFRSYVLNSENKLVESDRLELPLDWSGQWRGIWGEGDSIRNIERQIAFDGAHLVAGNPRNNTVYIFDVSANGVFGEASITDPQAQCDYSSADLFDGWGWNASTGTSCAPVVPGANNPVDNGVAESDCDYSNADQYGGWGWNASAGVSCPPVVPNDTTAMNNTADSNCDYSNSDQYGGWGWNATTNQSCAPVEAVSNPQATVQCIDADGDGWGWDGVSSCQVSAACIDADGDGWGWNSATSQSCRI